MGVGSGVSVSAHPRIDDIGAKLTNALFGEPPSLHDPWSKILRDDAAERDQPFGELAAFRRAHVERDPELVAVVVIEHPALVGVGVRLLLPIRAHRSVLVERQPSRHVQPVAILDTDDLRAEVR
jgi:hypothetical protein